MQDSSKAKDPFKSRENGYINHVIRNCTTYVKQAICKVTCSQGPNKSRECEEFFYSRQGISTSKCMLLTNSQLMNCSS